MSEYLQTIPQLSGYHVYVQALLIIAASALVALVVLPFVSGIVRYLTGKTSTDVDDKLIAAFQRPVFYIILLGGVALALNRLELSATVDALVDQALQSLVVLIVGFAITRAVRIVLDEFAHARRFKAVNDQTLPLFNNIAFIIVAAAAIYALFLVWDINITAWLASAGVIGIAVGFAAKDTLANIISGVFILADKPYSVGDFVELGSGKMGIVANVGLRSTRIRTFDDSEVTIPNAVIANEAITNKTTGPDTGRVSLNIGVAYGSDIEKVKALLLEAAREHETVVDDPEPAVFFINFGDSSLDFVLYCRVPSALDVFGTTSDLRMTVDAKFREAGIEIPFPQRDVHMKKD